MNERSYVFGDFNLNIKARELKRQSDLIVLSASAFDCLAYLVSHRDRPVGRDELISAVWGRVDVSDGLLAQIIVRLRRIFADNNSVQSYIRTVPRIGYRWVADTQSVDIQLADQTIPAADFSPKLYSPPDTLIRVARPAYARLIIASILIAVCGVIGWAIFYHRQHRIHSSEYQVKRSVTVVLPATVSAPGQWKWLEFGIMALISEQISATHLRVMSSSNVVSLLHDNPTISPSVLFEKPGLSVASIVQPVVTLSGGTWSVQLLVDHANGVRENVEVSGSEVLDVSRAAADLLLVRSGEVPTKRIGAMANSVEMLYRQVNAARLAGHADVSRALIAKASPDLKQVPLIRFASAVLICESEVNRDPCKTQLQDVLAATQSKPGDQGLKARILIELARQNVYDDPQQNDRFLRTAETLLDEIGDRDYLAFTYLISGYNAYLSWDLASASRATARARASYAELNDAMGLARSDFQEGLIADRLGQLDLSIRKLEAAEKAFSNLGIKSMLPVTWDALASVRSSRLQFIDEFSGTDTFWPVPDALPVASKMELYLVRATALLDTGRISEAKAVMFEMEDNPALSGLPDVRAEVSVLNAKLAYDQGDMHHAVAACRRAMTASLAHADRRQYASTWLLYIRSLRGDGNVAMAAKETAQLSTWSAGSKNTDEWLAVYSGLAVAEQYVAEKRNAEADTAYSDILARAERFGSPDLIVDTALSYLPVALASEREDIALGLSGTLANWAKVDMRAAYAVGLVARATGDKELYRQSMDDAQRLAGQRTMNGIIPWSASHR